MDHSKQLQAICSGMKILQKSYVQANWNTYIRTICLSWSQAPLNNTTPRVSFLQNQQPVTTHSMNPLMLPFLPTPNHQTRLLMQKNPKTSSLQNKNNISVLPSRRHPLHSNSWQFPKYLPMLNFCETQSCYMHRFFCWSTDPRCCNVFLILKIKYRKITTNSCGEKSSCNSSFKSQNPKIMLTV